MRKYSLFSSLIAVSIFFLSFPLVSSNATSEMPLVVEPIQADDADFSDVSEASVDLIEVPVVAIGAATVPQPEATCPQGSASCGRSGPVKVFKTRPLQRIKRLFRR